MDRLSKKCFLASGIVHGTLVLLLIVGPAFLTSENKLDSSQILTFVPDIALSSGAAVVGQGNPNAGRSEPAPLQPAPRLVQPRPPAPAPAPRNDSPPVRPAPTRPTSSPDALETSSQRPLVNINNVVRRDNSRPKNTSSNASELAAERARAAADARRRADALNAAVAAISSGASRGVEVGTFGSANGSGPSVGSFGDILRTIYFNNWHEPSDATSDDAVVGVTVTIARDGSVENARITRPSGDSAVDRSVQQTLRNVTFIRAFPADWKESRRQFQLNFSLKAKRSAV